MCLTLFKHAMLTKAQSFAKSLWQTQEQNSPPVAKMIFFFHFPLRYHLGQWKSLLYCVAEGNYSTTTLLEKMRPQQALLEIPMLHPYTFSSVCWLGWIRLFVHSVLSDVIDGECMVIQYLSLTGAVSFNGMKTDILASGSQQSLFQVVKYLHTQTEADWQKMKGLGFSHPWKMVIHGGFFFVCF